ncbi:dipeptide ABC transporter ATP-binding protein [Ideonella dechloratans]|uniref:Dipeptide ABC transporter ATP-binding protein n=1 Tax=Ideonella dechloratans TaxID=36863 RepID=A0A643FH36_IDEDE|nr:dipeptide ABC transporter ATP-binding protein [Ideonella dechloratans]KAB0585332.1 dipeptide ABC transporter ATP-binding protein [Ideonella dechloratans]UFU09274.1 dipeptide ABC transporter ATP-binding protein [Ideonella dechloratans]
MSAAAETAAPVLEARELQRLYPVARGLFKPPATVHALDGVSFSLQAGRTLAVVGESGCGKSTLAKLLTMIETPTAGQLLIDGLDVAQANGEQRRALRRQVQIVFQNPYGSLNPRQTIGRTLMEPLEANHVGSPAEREAAARAMLARVGLREEAFGRYPHMFSGGQRQRVAIARALMLQPRVLVLDEPVSALDVSIRAQVLNLLADLQRELGVAYLFISHDLGVVRHVADEVMVMYLGRCVERGTRDAVFGHPRHPYTQALLSATPTVDPAQRRTRIILQGELPSPIARPSGCGFRTRCPLAFERCAAEVPVLEAGGKGQTEAACWAST